MTVIIELNVSLFEEWKSQGRGIGVILDIVLIEVELINPCSILITIIIIFHGLFIHYLHHIVADLLGDLKVFIPRQRTNIGNTDSMVVPEVVKIVPRDSFDWLVGMLLEALLGSDLVSIKVVGDQDFLFVDTFLIHRLSAEVRQLFMCDKLRKNLTLTVSSEGFLLTFSSHFDLS